MDVAIPDKTYFRIGEVSKILGVDPYVVRYWESEFRSVKPIRTKSYQRLYRRADVEELVIIKKLLYTDHFTIRGAKRQLSRIKGEATQDDQYLNREILDKIKKILQEIRAIIN
jgi:DNA-binding transcriptional MerR regulator